MIFKPWGIQKDILRSVKRIIGAFAGKRGGKTEIGAVRGIMYQEQKTNYVDNGIDPFIGVIIAPTTDMLRRLSLKKFMAYAKPFITNYNISTSEITWHDGSIIYGISADKPSRLEGIKAHWIWIDEVFQCKEQLFLEAKARTSDTQGNILCTGSLGTQYINPKMHWAHLHFKEKPDKNTQCYEWSTKDNPYFPEEEIENLKNTLDPQTFRAMFELNWDVNPSNGVYSEYGENNRMKGYTYDKKLETYISIDWGFAHPMAVLFIQYDRIRDVVYVFDEIVESKIKVFDGTLWNKIMAKFDSNDITNVTAWVCDIAGAQEREVGISNMSWFIDNKDINFKARQTRINFGIPIVRGYIKNGMGQTKMFVHETKCPKLDDGLKQYRYNEKDGIILNENPVKEHDDAVDSLRYFYVNVLDRKILTRKTTMRQL